MLEFQVDTSCSTSFSHYWELCVGSCHAYTALREDWRKQLKKTHDELGFQYVRFHGLLNDQMSVCVRKESFHGEDLGIVYNFTNIDNIFDFLLSIGMKPFIELGFMPSCLASGEQTCFHYKGNVTMPKVDQEWMDLIQALVEHLIERYGIEEVKKWYFEVWNEPNLSFFFAGSMEDYFHLYEITARTIKNVHKDLRVGGPATSVNAWIPEMISFCETNGVPLDFISTHHYPTDDPLWKNGTNDYSILFETGKVTKENMFVYERDTLYNMTKKAKEQAGKYPLYYTEWNTSARFNEDQHDEPYAGAMIVKTIVDNAGLVEAYSYWTFTDIFEEAAQLKGFFHGGFGLQNIAGVEKPVYRAFELLHQLGDERYEVTGSEKSNVGVVATKCEEGYFLIAYNHNVLNAPIKEETIKITMKGADLTDQKITLYRIDDEHANAVAAWKKIGTPEYPSINMVSELRKQCKMKPELVKDLNITIPANGVVGIRIGN